MTKKQIFQGKMEFFPNIAYFEQYNCNIFAQFIRKLLIMNL